MNGNIASILFLKVVNDFSPLPNDKILDLPKFKAFADNKLNVAKMKISSFDRVEGTVGKGKISFFDRVENTEKRRK